MTIKVQLPAMKIQSRDVAKPPRARAGSRRCVGGVTERLVSKGKVEVVLQSGGGGGWCELSALPGGVKGECRSCIADWWQRCSFGSRSCRWRRCSFGSVSCSWQPELQIMLIVPEIVALISLIFVF